MERREALKKAMLALGGVLSGPTLLAFDNFEKNILLTGDFTLNAMQKRIVAEVAEMIIPRTTTAGAKDVGVPAFIEMMMRDCFRAQEQNNFRDGLEELKLLVF